LKQAVKDSEVRWNRLRDRVADVEKFESYPIDAVEHNQ
jgi:hypothetical protein